MTQGGREVSASLRPNFNEAGSQVTQVGLKVPLAAEDDLELLTNFPASTS